jgi:hypothetical protein
MTLACQQENESETLLNEAKRAFSTDPEYLIAMCKAASDLERRRQVWANRRMRSTKLSA